MKPDIYTKTVLTIIAIMLTVIAVKPIISPDITAHADGPFSGVQFAVEHGNPSFFDTRTGELVMYNGISTVADGTLLWEGSGTLLKRAKLTQFGKPLNDIYFAKH